MRMDLFREGKIDAMELVFIRVSLQKNAIECSRRDVRCERAGIQCARSFKRIGSRRGRWVWMDWFSEGKIDAIVLIYGVQFYIHF